MEDAKLTVTVTEAAALLGISRNLAYELVGQGRLPAIRISEKRIVVPRVGLERMLAEAGQPKTEA